MLTVTAAAPNYDLTLLATVKSELGIVSRDEDENLARWITRASKAISKHCHRVFLQETVVETIRLRGPAEDLLLDRYPIGDITSIVECDVSLTADDYEVNAESGMVTRLRGGNPTCWACGRIVVTYTGGYERTDLPEDVEGAAIALVKQYRFAAERDPQIRSEQIEGAGAQSYFDGQESRGMSPEIAGMLSMYVKPIG
jgi:hypothetical protein